MGMVAFWIVIMCSMSCAISKSQVSPSLRKSPKVRDLGDTCTKRLCSVDQFLELAPCPPPQKTHLLCDIPVSLTCQERTKILRKCIKDNELNKTTISRVFESCNQSFIVQCDEFFSLCKSETNFKCGSPLSTIAPSPVRPPILNISTTERLTTVSTYNVSDTALNDSELEVNDSRPEHPVDNAGAEDRNWLPLLSLLAIPILAIVVCSVYCARKRRRKKSNGSHGNGSAHEESKEIEMPLSQTYNKRKSYIGDGDKFKDVPYIDEVETTKIITEED